jgi:hypothetical protein
VAGHKGRLHQSHGHRTPKLGSSWFPCRAPEAQPRRR